MHHMLWSYGRLGRQAGEPSVEAKTAARHQRDRETVEALLRHTTLIGPQAGAALAALKTTDGRTLGA